MIIDFFVKNFCCFKERHGISFVASEFEKTLPENIIELDLPGVKGLKLLKGIAIMGANASGKSTILDALCALKKIITQSFSEYDILEKTIFPFALNEYSDKEPTEFFVRFISENIRYHYTLVVNTTQVIYESLSTYPQGRERLLFEREWENNSYRFESRSSDIKKIEHMVRPNTSLISVANALNNEDISPVFTWFQKNLGFIDSAKRINPKYTLDIFNEETPNNSILKNKVLEFIKKADFGIDNIFTKKNADNFIIKNNKTEKKVYQSFKNELFLHSTDKKNTNNTLKEKIEKIKIILDKIQNNNIYFSHFGENKEKYQLDFKNESDGTYKYFAMAGFIADILVMGKAVGIDEIETSLHPILVRFLLDQFFSKRNDKNAQILFTTHDISLMRPSFMRRDQFFFVEKNSIGQSSITSLSDYKQNNNESLSAGYLAGRYGAIPKIFDIDL